MKASKHPLIESHRTQSRCLASHYGPGSIRVFGSTARDVASNLSDVDFLVEGPGPLSGFSLGALLMDAQDLLGRRVDIVPVNSSYPLMRDRVLRESLPICLTPRNSVKTPCYFRVSQHHCS